MSIPRPASPVKLVMSLIGSDGETVCRVLAILMERFGDADYISPYLPFDYTTYYEKEMGADLSRRFVSFDRHIPPETLPDVKNWTNELEVRFAAGEARRINIDPGYIAAAHLILATGKGYTHRPYLRDGIYADLTLMFGAGRFQPLPWTYPDYAAAAGMLKAVRNKYIEELRKTGRKDYD